jgi:hypothetical protein
VFLLLAGERVMSRLILPGIGAVTWECGVCGQSFDFQREQQEHVGRCAREHMDEIREASLKQRMPVFDEETWDPGVAEHLRDGAGRRMREAVDRLGVERAKRDGHMEVRPNEKAGL